MIPGVGLGGFSTRYDNHSTPRRNGIALFCINTASCYPQSRIIGFQSHLGNFWFGVIPRPSGLFLLFASWGCSGMGLEGWTFHTRAFRAAFWRVRGIGFFLLLDWDHLVQPCLTLALTTLDVVYAIRYWHFKIGIFSPPSHFRGIQQVSPSDCEK